MAQQRKRTAGDDLRDFKAGKISGNYYHNGIDRSDNYIQHTSAPRYITDENGKKQVASYNEWLEQEVFQHQHELANGTSSTSSNSKTATNDTAVKNSNNTSSDTGSDIKTFFNGNLNKANSSAEDFREAIKNPNKSLDDKVKGLTYMYNAAVATGDTKTAEKMQKEYDEIADRVNKQTEINRQKAEAYARSQTLKGMTEERKSLSDELDGIYHKIEVNRARSSEDNKRIKEINSKIGDLDKQIAEKQRNGEYDLSDSQKAVLADIGDKANKLTESFENKYKNSTLKQRQDARIHATTSELNWLNKHMYANATSEELEDEYNKYKNEYETKRKAIQNDSSNNKGLQYTNLKEEYDEKIGNIEAEILKVKQRDAGKVLNDNIKAKTVMQKYYSLNLYNELKDELGHKGYKTDEEIDGILKSKTQKDSFDYISKLSEDERNQIEKDFNNLSIAGYDKGNLYKWYKRESNAKIADEVNGNIREFADDHPVVASAASVGLRLAGAVPDAVKYVSAKIDKNNGGDGYINPNETYTAMSDNIRAKVSENINNDFGSFLYNTGMSIADFASLLPLNAVPGGQVLSLGIMGTSAGVGAANEVIENGGTIDNAVKTGIAAGIAETLFEKVSLEQLSVFKASGKSTLRAAVGNVLKGAFTEGSEEAFTDLANRLTDDAINKDLSSYNLSKKKYMEQGMSEAEAENAASWDFWKQVGLDFAGGAVSGGVLNLATAGVNLGGVQMELAQNKESNLADGKQALADENFDLDLLIRQGLATEKNDKAYNLAKRMKKSIDTKGRESIGAADVGNLRYLIGREISRNPELINKIAQVEKQDTQEQNNQTVNVQNVQNPTQQNTVQNVQNTAQDEQQNAKQTQANTVINATKKADTEAIGKMYGAYAFGKKHPNGIIATDTSTGKVVKVALKSLESSAKINRSDKENTLIFNTNDGKQVNADSITFSDSQLDTIVHGANEFDTYGARNYISNFEEWRESPQAQKMSDEEMLSKYNKAYSAAYSFGREGVKLNSLKETSEYKILKNILGEQIVSQALSAGKRDVDINTQHHANRLTELINRNGRADTSGVSVYADSGTDVSHIPQELIDVLGNLAKKTGRNIIISDRLADGVNGVATGGNIILSSEISSQKILATAFHEAGHMIKKTNPTEWRTLSDFVADYLVRNGYDLNKMIDRKIEKYGNRLKTDENENIRDAALEEIICDTLMSIASNENALNIALSTKQNKSKIAAAIKSLVAKVKDWLIGKSKNYGAKAFAKDLEALENLAQRFSEAADTARENITEQAEIQNGEKIDVEKYSIKRKGHYAKQGGKFSGALTENEWASFYSSVMKSNQRNYFRVGNNGILISDDTNPLNYKLVCYEGDSSEPLVTAVYKLENYDYNIHDKQFKLTTLLEILKRSDDNEKHARSILENNRSVYGTIFKKYSTKSRRFNDLTRKHNRNLQDVGVKSNGTGANQEIGQELSAGVKENFTNQTEVQNNEKIDVEKFSFDEDTNINIDDIKILRSIDRKSINDFNSDDIQKTEKWARKFYKELGVKSPFFRAWFGDWRAYDNNEVNTLTLNDTNKVKKGTIQNKDTGFNIDVSRKGIDHIMVHLHNSEFAHCIVNNLHYITENAILLDTYISKKTGKTKHKNTSFMHSFYIPVEYHEKKAIIKLYVEEYYNDWNDKIQRRDYDIKKIETLNDADRFGENFSAPLYASKNVSINSIADLFEYVNMYDKEFNPKSVSPILLNQDGTPKTFYHSTNENFTEFKIGNGILGKGIYFSDYSQQIYGRNVIKAFLKAENPVLYRKLPKGAREVNSAGIETRVIDDFFEKFPAYDAIVSRDEIVVKSALQVKSATDNIGTFDGNNPDIRYSLDEDYDFSDPSKLDDRELKIYNNRGWSYGLFNKEDMTLLSEKVRELKKDWHKADNALWDGSRLVEINNKLVILGGTFNNPEIYNVLVINANNEAKAEFIKEYIYNEFDNFRRNKETLGSLFEFEKNYDGEELVRTYMVDDFKYHKGRNSEWTRATLPSNFEDYGYTEGRNERYGSSFRTGKSVSSVQLNEETDNNTDEKAGAIHDTLKFSMDDEYDDWLVNDDGKSVFDAVKDEKNPDRRISILYHYAGKTAEHGMSVGKDIRIGQSGMHRLVCNVLQEYGVNLNGKNKSRIESFKSAVQDFENSVKNDTQSFNDAIESLAEECKEYLKNSSLIDKKHSEWAKDLSDSLKEVTLVIPKGDIDFIKSAYGSITNFRKALMGKINIRTAKGYALIENANESSIEDVGNSISEIIGDIAGIDETFNWKSEEGYKTLERFINYDLAEHFVSIDGKSVQSIDETAIEMAFDVATEYLKQQAKEVVADNNADKELLHSITEIYNQADEEHELLLKEKNARYAEQISEQKKNAEKQIKSLVRKNNKRTEQYIKNDIKLRNKIKSNAKEYRIILRATKKTVAEEYRAERDKTKYRQKISTTLERLINRHLKPKPNNNVPISVVKPLYRLLSELTGNYSGFSKGVNDITEKTGYNKTVNQKGERVNTVTLSRETEKLISALNNEIASTDGKITLPPAMRNALLGYNVLDNDGNIKQHFTGLLEDVRNIFEKAEKNGKTSLKDFSLDELERISTAFSEVKKLLDAANKIVINGKEYDAYLVSRKGAEELQKVTGTHKKGSNTQASTAKRVLLTYRKYMSDPVRFARMISGYHNDSVIVQMMEMLNQGQSDAKQLSLDWTNEFEEQMARFSYKAKKTYVREQAMEFDGIDPNTKKPLIDRKTGEQVRVGLTADMLVEMLLEYEDEYGRAHMMYSGYQVPNIKYIKRKNQQLMYSKDSGCYILPTESDISRIRDYVMNNEIAKTVYEICREMYNEDMQNAVNKVSNEKYGYEIAKVKNYCPITIDEDTVYGTFADVLINRSINSRAFLHEREDFKYNRLKLKGATAKLTSQIKSVSSWCGLTMPIETFNRVFNMPRYDHANDKLVKAVQEENLKSAENIRQKNNTHLGEENNIKYSNVSFSQEHNSETKEIVKITLKNANKISSEKVFDVTEDVTKNFERKSEGIAEFFKKLGNKATNPELGIVELGKKGARSTLFHGFGNDKLIAVGAIKDVIEHGTIINKTEKYKGKDYDRYILAGRGLIEGKDCYVSVVIKSYPNNKNLNSKFYLHEVTKIETDPHIMTSSQSSENLVSESVPESIKPQDNENVKLSIDEVLDYIEREEQQKKKKKKSTPTTEYFPSMKEIMKQQWGNESEEYISKLMGDLQGSTKQADPGRIDMLTGKYIIAVLMANISSAIKQLSSYPLAAARVGWKATLAGLKHIRPGKHTPFLNRALPDSYKQSIPYDEIAKYTPILEYRKQGNNSREMAEISKYKGLIDSSGWVGHTLDRLNWIEKNDVLMVEMNYWIAYEHVKGNMGISPDSKEFMPNVAKTLEDIINNMMPNSSVMQQGQILRSKNPVNRIFTICKSQVFCMVNAAMDASGEYNARLKDYKQAVSEFEKEQARTEVKIAKKQLARTYSAIIVSTAMTCGILMPLIAALFGKWDRYRDEDGNITPWSVGSRLLKDFGSELTGMFLFGDTVYNTVLSLVDKNEEFYGLSLPGVDTVNDFITGIINIARSDTPEKLRKNISSLVGTLGMLTGLPTKNLMNLFQGACNHIENFTKYGGTPTVNDYGEVSMQMYANYCYEALIDGDKKKFAKLYSEWLKEKTSAGKQVDKSYINSKLKTELEDDTEIIAAGNAFFNGDLTAYENTVEKYSDLGFDKTTVVNAINSIVSDLEDEQKTSEGLDEYDNEEESDSEPELYKYSDAFDFLKNGDTESYEKVEKYLMEHKDKSKSEIKKLMQSASRTDPMFEQYISASKNNDADTTHTLYRQLLNIYGSESSFKSALKKYQDKIKKQQSK